MYTRAWALGGEAGIGGSALQPHEMTSEGTEQPRSRIQYQVCLPVVGCAVLSGQKLRR